MRNRRAGPWAVIVIVILVVFAVLALATGNGWWWLGLPVGVLVSGFFYWYLWPRQRRI